MGVLSWLSKIAPPTPKVDASADETFSGDWQRPPANVIHSSISDPLTHFALVFSALVHDVGKFQRLAATIETTNSAN